jgi:hypothetical protein
MRGTHIGVRITLGWPGIVNADPIEPESGRNDVFLVDEVIVKQVAGFD